MSERRLSERPVELTAAGRVARHVDEVPPVAVRYRRTRRGEALRPALAELEQWGDAELLEPTTPGGG